MTHAPRRYPKAAITYQAKCYNLPCPLDRASAGPDHLLDHFSAGRRERTPHLLSLNGCSRSLLVNRRGRPDRSILGSFPDIETPSVEADALPPAGLQPVLSPRHELPPDFQAPWSDAFPVQSVFRIPLCFQSPASAGQDHHPRVSWRTASEREDNARGPLAIYIDHKNNAVDLLR